MLPGQESFVSGYDHGYDDGTTGAEVVHKATHGFVHVVNVAIDGTAYVAGAVLEIRDGTGAANAVWQLTIPALGAADVSLAFPVLLDARFETDIRTILTAGAGTMSVSFV
jgi:hypothetical protein